MIIGKKELEDALKRIPQSDFYAAAQKAIKIVQEEAKMLCRVHDGELRDSIYTDTEADGDYVRATCYTDKEYAPYVEFGTGPKGQASHDGISPYVTVSYSQSPWWIHESQVDERTAETYHWFYIDTPQGRFYQCAGQAAHPFMYPALKNNTERIEQLFEEVVRTL